MRRVKSGWLALLVGTAGWLQADTLERLWDSSLMQNSRARFGVSTAFEYRLGVLYQSPATTGRPAWYASTHLDTVLLREGFNPLNIGLEVGVRPRPLPALALGLHLEQPLYTDNRLVGLSSTLHGPVLGRRVEPFISIQLLRYNEPIDGLNGYTRRRFFNTLIGFNVKLGSTQ